MPGGGLEGAGRRATMAPQSMSLYHDLWPKVSFVAMPKTIDYAVKSLGLGGRNVPVFIRDGEK
jgi:hypothetical protein